jgi:integrase/recombinase XerD
MLIAPLMSAMSSNYTARRVRLPTSGVESWTVIGPDLRPVAVVDDYLGWLTGIERSPNTVEAYARDLSLFFAFLDERGLNWQADVDVAMMGEFSAWARRPAANVLLLSEQAARRSTSTVNRMLTSVVGFYEFHGRRGNRLATELVVKTRYGRGGYKAFLAGMAPTQRRGRAGRLPQERKLPRTLTLEQVAAVIDAQRRLRDRFLFALLASTGMRIGQALALRHEDVVSWERRIVIEPRQGAPARARSKLGGRASVPVPDGLMRLWSDYMHEEYGDLDAEHVFVNLWEGRIGRPMSYATVDKLIARTRKRVGFHFTAHMFRHTYATVALRDGVQLEVIGAVLTHRSPSSTGVYTHLTAEDLRRALDERGVLDRVGDLVA